MGLLLYWQFSVYHPQAPIIPVLLIRLLIDQSRPPSMFKLKALKHYQSHQPAHRLYGRLFRLFPPLRRMSLLRKSQRVKPIIRLMGACPQELRQNVRMEPTALASITAGRAAIMEG